MPIVKKEYPFIMVDRKYLEDKSLSFGARGLLIYLAALPEGAKLDIRNIAADSTDSVQTVRSLFDELGEAGYIDIEEPIQH